MPALKQVEKYRVAACGKAAGEGLERRHYRQPATAFCELYQPLYFVAFEPRYARTRFHLDEPLRIIANGDNVCRSLACL